MAPVAVILSLPFPASTVVSTFERSSEKTYLKMVSLSSFSMVSNERSVPLMCLISISSSPAPPRMSTSSVVSRTRSVIEESRLAMNASMAACRPGVMPAISSSRNEVSDSNMDFAVPPMSSVTFISAETVGACLTLTVARSSPSPMSTLTLFLTFETLISTSSSSFVP